MSKPFLFVFFFLKRTSCLACFKQKRQHCSWANWKVFFSCSFFCFLSKHCFFFFFCNIFDHARKEKLLFWTCLWGLEVLLFLLSQLVLSRKKKKGNWKSLLLFFFFLKELFLCFQSNFFVGFILSNFVSKFHWTQTTNKKTKCHDHELLLVMSWAKKAWRSKYLLLFFFLITHRKCNLLSFDKKLSFPQELTLFLFPKLWAS